MNKTFARILKLIEGNDLKISAQGYDELAEDNILVKDILVNVKNAILLEEYPNYIKDLACLFYKKISRINLFM